MKLVCIKGKEKDRVWNLEESRTIIGRDPSCDIPISDPKLSRIHAEIVREGDASIFYDKNSLNGSYINDDRVARQVLIPGDRIEIGETRIEVLKEDLPPGIRWQEEGSPFVTTVIPLDMLSNQLEELTASPEPISEADEKTATKKGTLMERLLKNLETIYEVGSAINSVRAIDRLLDQIAEKILEVFANVQTVCILLEDNGEDFRPRFVKNRAEVATHPFQISRSIVNQSVEQQVCILANDASQDARFSTAESVIALSLRSVMCAPLVSKGAVLGLIYLDNPRKPNCFDENDMALLSALANQSATALENSRLYENLQKAYYESILALMNTVEAKDPYTRGHSQRTSRYALGIAQEMKLSEQECKKIKTAAELHDIGKIGVKDLIIDKDSALSTQEFHTIQAHVLTGEKILKPIEYLSFALPTVRHHHEQYDGSGYPDGLKGDEIPIGARIVGVADAFDAMTTQRPYNKPMPMKKAMEKLKALKGKQFDPAAVDALDRFVTQNLI
jgi:HD-GYP domain-containing protein (c-di-GMP phosphodiesterase class II)